MTKFTTLRDLKLGGAGLSAHAKQWLLRALQQPPHLAALCLTFTTDEDDSCTLMAGRFVSSLLRVHGLQRITMRCFGERGSASPCMADHLRHADG